ncbi:MAG: HipA domain-containing protein [Pseudomonadota bacterium]
MKICLACEKEITEKTNYNFHKSCLKKTFNSSYLPEITFGYADLNKEALNIVGLMSISGAQIKLPVKIIKKVFTVTAYETSHILKPSPSEYPYLAENENLCMNMYEKFDSPRETAIHSLIELKDGKYAYIVKRFDRDYEGKNQFKIHVEDFCQLLEKDDKYIGSIEQIGKFILANSAIPHIDTQKLFLRCIFNFLIGNGDAHLKNFSLRKHPSYGYRLSPVYDLVCSKIYLKNEDDSALSINGKKNNLNKNDFKNLATYLEIENRRYFELMNRASYFYDNELQQHLNNSFLPENIKIEFKKIIDDRFNRLFSC